MGTWSTCCLYVTIPVWWRLIHNPEKKAFNADISRIYSDCGRLHAIAHAPYLQARFSVQPYLRALACIHLVSALKPCLARQAHPNDLRASAAPTAPSHRRQAHCRSRPVDNKQPAPTNPPIRPRLCTAPQKPRVTWSTSPAPPLSAPGTSDVSARPVCTRPCRGSCRRATRFRGPPRHRAVR
jgi:hypothetical protein